MAKAMIITVGTGETVSSGICSSIRNQNPDYIAFILTQESKNKTLPLILQDRSMLSRKYDEISLTNEIDVEDIHLECKKIIEGINRKGYDPKDIVIDFTSGTKAMSVGLTLAALDKRVGSLTYVSGKRNENGRVISGTERPLTIEPNRIYADLLFNEAVNLFNKCQFDGCLAIIGQAKDLVADPKIQNKFATLETLAEAYSLWDKFDLNEAFSKLCNISDNPLLVEWGVKSKVEDHKQVLHKEKKDNFCIERIVDLLENARRRGDLERKCDDAVARLYRCLEYIGQLRMAEKNLYKKDAKGNPDTGDLDVNHLPEELQDKYIKYKDQKDNKVKLGLHQNFELLSDLGDNSGKLLIEGSLKKLLSLRNNSILAHGFGPISEETYREMFSEIKKLTKDFLPQEADCLTKKASFPKVKI